MSKCLLFLIFFTLSAFQEGQAEIPTEPVGIGFEPQYFVDDFIADNRWVARLLDELKGQVNRI